MDSRAYRVSVVEPKRRRGQTLILALAILFLFVVLGGIFVTMVIRNVQRTGRQGISDDAVTLALAGIQHAAQQFRNSRDGADWRPRSTEFLWRTPAAPPGSVSLPQPDGSTLTLPYAQVRDLDPDNRWLSDEGRYLRPYVRVMTERGRFLLRVTYEPRMRTASAASEGAGIQDEFDANSGMIHIESIGRPGEFDPNDPTFLRDPSDDEGQFHKVEAFVPVGLVDQLMWITNFTNERGPATLGVAPFVSGSGEKLEYPELLYGGIRSEVDLQWHGRNVVRLYPARGDSLTVKGKILTSNRENYFAYVDEEPQVKVEALDDTGETNGAIIPPDQGNDDPTDDSRITTFLIDWDSDNPLFAAEYASKTLVSQGNEVRRFVRDERHLRDEGQESGRTAKHQVAPALTQTDAATGLERYVLLTRDSGGTVQVQDNDGTGTQLVNTGAYGLTDRTLPPQVRAKGLYLDNWGDIQLPGDRRRIKTAWLKPQSQLGQDYGWSADFTQYVPSTIEENVNHPVAEVELTEVPVAGGGAKPVIRIYRYDLDPRQRNVPPSTGRRRQFYGLTGLTVPATGVPTATLTLQSEDANGNGQLDPGEDTNGNGELDGNPFVRDFDWPENGVFLAEGSIRVRTTEGAFGGAGYQAAPLTIVSKGTIYIEGNIKRLNDDNRMQIGLLAHDYVTLNPTAFTRISAGPGVDLPRPDMPGSPERGHHYTINQGQHIDFITNSAETLQQALVFLKHSGQMGDSAITALALHQPNLPNWPVWGTTNYAFGAAGNVPPPYVANGENFYLFREKSPGDPNHWNESDHRSLEGGPDLERKMFSLPGAAAGGGAWNAGVDAFFRLEVVPKDVVLGAGDPRSAGTDQPYWFSRAAIVPQDGPLPIRIEAVIYAFTGSWFIIPPPYFNDDAETRDDRRSYVAAGARKSGTYPPNMPLPFSDANYEASAGMHYPFFNEPLNLDVQIVGAITENMPANPSERAEWTRRMWTMDLDLDRDPTTGVTDNDPTLPFPPPHPTNRATWAGRRSRFSPRISYRYDYNLKRLVRARMVDTGMEEVVSLNGNVPGVRTLAQFVGDPDNDPNTPATNSYVETLPVLPKLPASAVIYEGNPL